MWEPISRSEFERLYQEQNAQLSTEQKEVFEKYRIPIGIANICRSEKAGLQCVFVVAASESWGVLYFDDIEYGFNASQVDASDLILDPRGNQFTLSEAVEHYMVK